MGLCRSDPFCAGRRSAGGGSAIAVPTQDAAGHVVTLSGMLWLPQGRPRAAFILANGSGGWRDAREGYYGRMLAAEGYAALAVDSFGARGISDTVSDQSQLSYLQMLRDAYAARRLLIEQGMAADRMGIIGWSRGGTVALAAADGTFIPQEAGGFRAAVAFYPGCNFRTRVPKPRSLLFVAIGEKDDYTGVKQCQAIVDDFGKAGGKVSLKLYPASGHQFDGDPSHSRMNRDFMAETSTECSGFVEEDGEASFAGRKFNLESGFNDLLVYARQTGCIGHGATMWTNPTQKEAVRRDLMDFLNSAFPLVN